MPAPGCQPASLAAPGRGEAPLRAMSRPSSVSPRPPAPGGGGGGPAGGGRAKGLKDIRIDEEVKIAVNIALERFRYGDQRGEAAGRGEAGLCRGPSLLPRQETLTRLCAVGTDGKLSMRGRMDGFPLRELHCASVFPERQEAVGQRWGPGVDPLLGGPGTPGSPQPRGEGRSHPAGPSGVIGAAPAATSRN